MFKKSARTGHCVGTEFNTSNEELLRREPIPFWSASSYSQLSKMVISPAVETLMLPHLGLAFLMAIILGGSIMGILWVCSGGGGDGGGGDDGDDGSSDSSHSSSSDSDSSSDSSSNDSDEDEPAVAGGGGDDNDDDNFDNNGGNNNNLAAYWVWQHEKLAQIQQHVDDELLPGFDQQQPAMLPSECAGGGAPNSSLLFSSAFSFPPLTIFAGHWVQVWPTLLALSLDGQRAELPVKRFVWASFPTTAKKSKLHCVCSRLDEDQSLVGKLGKPGWPSWGGGLGMTT
uniref:Uncharacterized protein n=1 Tax=Globodera pallida TaxID=36090 RepID=A0A183BW18_GLOPA